MNTTIEKFRLKNILFTVILIIGHFIICAQTVNFEAPTIVLNHTENSTVATINLDVEQTELSAVTFTVKYDGGVLSPTGFTMPNGVQGAANPNVEDEITIALFFPPDPFGSTVPAYNDGLIDIDFDYIGAGGTQSPLVICIVNVFDDNEITDIATIVNGSISKTCSANPINGCTKFNYQEYNPLANCDDGTCATLVCHDSNFQKINQYDNYTSVRPQLSSTGNRIAFIDNNVIKLFEAQNNSWEQIALDLTLDAYSYGITLSGDGGKIAVISIDKSTSPYTYFVQTYFLLNDQWLKLTNDLIPDIGGFTEIVLSNDGNTILAKGFNVLKVFKWNNSEWQEKGSAFTGQDFWYPNLSDDGNTVLFNDGYIGTVTASMYSYDGSDWTAKGNLTGTNARFNLNHKGDVVLGYEFTTLYIDPNLTFYAYDGSDWSQVGTTQSFTGIIGNDMSGDLSNFTITDRNSIIDIYKYNGSEWNNVSTLTYEDNGFRFWNCQFSFDGNALLVRGYVNDDDDVGLTAYYANECNNINQIFCVDTQVLNGVIDAGIYKSGNIIQADGTVDIRSGGNVELESQNMVELRSGFAVDDEISFEIRMQNCNPGN